MGMNASEVVRKSRNGGRTLRIQVAEGQETKVNVTVPLNLARVALKFIPKEAAAKLQEQSISLEDIKALVDSPDLEDVLVEVTDKDTMVKIFVE